MTRTDHIDLKTKASERMMLSSSNSRMANSVASPICDRDWSEVIVAKLKDEIRLRGFRTYGKKSELPVVANLAEYADETLNMATEHGVSVLNMLSLLFVTKLPMISCSRYCSKPLLNLV